MRNCDLCGNSFKDSNRRKICGSCRVSKRRRKIKQMAIEYKGERCLICGYDKCVNALSFHHLNESEKEFGISSLGHTRSWERVKKELDKCVLLCSNCHAEVHSGFHDEYIVR